MSITTTIFILVNVWKHARILIYPFHWRLVPNISVDYSHSGGWRWKNIVYFSGATAIKNGIDLADVEPWKYIHQNNEESIYHQPRDYVKDFSFRWLCVEYKFKWAVSNKTVSAIPKGTDER